MNSAGGANFGHGCPVRADPTLPLVFTRTEALAAGMSRHQIAHRIRTGTWRALRRAVYIQERRYAALTVREQHTTAVVATLMARQEEVVASHLSAALAYGWVLPLAGAGPVTLTNGDLDTPTRQAADLTVQVASLPTSDVRTCNVDVAGTRWEIPATSRSRTVADNLRHLPNADGVALADSALRGGGVSYDEVAAVLRRQSCWPYARTPAGRSPWWTLGASRGWRATRLSRFIRWGFPCRSPRCPCSTPTGVSSAESMGGSRTRRWHWSRTGERSTSSTSNPCRWTSTWPQKRWWTAPADD
jgi:hypothetical protein